LSGKLLINKYIIMRKVYALLLAIGLLTMPALLKADSNEISATLTSHTMYEAGTTMDLNFTIEWTSPDAEWFRGLEMTFPAGITPNTATDVGGDAADITGQVVDWMDASVNSSNGSVNFTVNVTIDAGLSGNQIADFYIEGDGWGALPHDFAGTTTIEQLPAVPLSNWAFALIGLFAISFVYFKFRK